MSAMSSRPSYRDHQIETLELMLGAQFPEMKIPECLMVQGVECTGKTSTLKWLLKFWNIPHAFVHCVEVYQHKLLFQSALQQISLSMGLSENSVKCDNVSDFLTELKKLLGQSKAVIVLESAERLREEGSLLAVFTTLQELSQSNVCCIFETRLDWSKLRPSEDIISPICVHFSQYSRDELGCLIGDLLNLEPSSDYGEQFRRGYGSLVVSVFYTVTRSLAELLHIAKLNYTNYTRPVVDGECKTTDTKKLWLNIEPELKKCLSTVHLREIASRQLTQSIKEAEVDEEIEINRISGPIIANVGRITIELPFYSKFLLIAAFLASYNPAKSDKRFFQKHHGKQRKTAHSIRAKEKMNSQLTGPKVFPLERLLAIFYNIVDEKVNPTASIYSQLTSLTNLQLLSPVGLDMMDQPKYKCNVSLDFVRTVAKPLQFDVYKYLYDHC